MTYSCFDTQDCSCLSYQKMNKMAASTLSMPNCKHRSTRRLNELNFNKNELLFYMEMKAKSKMSNKERD